MEPVVEQEPEQQAEAEQVEQEEEQAAEEQQEAAEEQAAEAQQEAAEEQAAEAEPEPPRRNPGAWANPPRINPGPSRINPGPRVHPAPRPNPPRVHPGPRPVPPRTNPGAWANPPRINPGPPRQNPGPRPPRANPAPRAPRGNPAPRPNPPEPERAPEVPSQQRHLAHAELTLLAHRWPGDRGVIGVATAAKGWLVANDAATTNPHRVLLFCAALFDCAGSREYGRCRPILLRLHYPYGQTNVERCKSAIRELRDILKKRHPARAETRTQNETRENDKFLHERQMQRLCN